MTRLRVVLAALGLILGLSLLAALPAEAGSGNDRAIRDLRTLRHVDRLVVIDVGTRHDRWIWAKRAHESRMPLTPLQVAIVHNPRAGRGDQPDGVELRPEVGLCRARRGLHGLSLHGRAAADLRPAARGIAARLTACP